MTSSHDVGPAIDAGGETLAIRQRGSDGALAAAIIMLNNNAVGGAERRFAQLYERLRRRGLAIALLINESLLRRLQASQLLTAADEEVVVLPEPMATLLPPVRNGGECADKERGHPLAFWWRKLDYVRAGISVRRWLIHHRPDTMHLLLGGAYAALPAQWMGGAPPAVLSVVCPSLREMVPTALGRWLYRAALRQARCIDALTEDVAIMLQREGVCKDRIRVSPGSCVDIDRFRPKAVRRPWVVFSGRLIAEKQPQLFVEACALVRDRCPEARFFLFGDGPLRSEIETLVRHHRLERELSCGWNPSVEDILSEALIFASLQRTDNYPSQALLEAMACGAAVVATDVGLTWKVVDEAVGFRVVPDATAVAARILALLEDRSLASALGRRARDRVINLHSMDAYADYLEGLYNDVTRES